MVYQKIRKLTFSLSLKLSICLVGSMIAVFLLLGYWHISLHEKDLEELTFQSAERISDAIKNSTRYSMMKNHRDEVFQIIRTMGAEPGLNKIRIFNQDGGIRVSTDESEVETQVDKRAEACYACHAQEQPLTRLNRPDRVRIYHAANGERILGLINPIENSPDCGGAGCHASVADQKVLGVLDVTMSLAKPDAMIASGRRQMIGTVGASIVLISTIFAALIWFMVYRPVHRLRLGIQQVAAGELDHKIEVSSRDEIGELAGSFNQMTEELKRAKDQVAEFTRSLEDRVEQKTEQLQRAHQRMIKIERMASMGQLAAIVAHEINNPLAGILTYARLLIKRSRNSQWSVNEVTELREDLELIANEASRCGEIVKGLLQFSRQSKKNYQANDLNQLIRESLRLIKHKLDLMNIQTSACLEPDIPPIVCDAQEIRQALVAILINACEAVSPNEGLVEAGTRHRMDLGVVEIWVRDNGVGMDEETQKHIFEPFFTTKEHGKGVGLGLAAVIGIVNQHSGEIEVESRPGAGTTFTIRLPLTSEAAASPDAKAAVV